MGREAAAMNPDARGGDDGSQGELFAFPEAAAPSRVARKVSYGGGTRDGMNNQEWNVRACSKVCATTGEPFADKQIIFSKLFFNADGTYERADYSEAGWTDAARAGAISTWKSIFHAPPAKAEDPLKKETVETLLRQFMAREDFSKPAVIYIMAVMLERKRVLVERDVQKREDGTRFRVYEHKKTGEVFTVPDPGLKLDELGQVQLEVNELLGIPPRGGAVAAAPVPAPASPEADG